MAGQPRQVVVWEEHRTALEVLRRCATLWRAAPTGGVLGLDRPSLESLMRMMRIKPRRRLALLDDIAVMERAALAIINQKKGS